MLLLISVLKSILVYDPAVGEGDSLKLTTLQVQVVIQNKKVEPYT